MKKTGTKEWAPKNVNICDGCSHNCRYCYARYDKTVRFKHMQAQDWEVEKINEDAVSHNYHKVKNVTTEGYDIMFPSAHDITPAILQPCIAVLKKLLEAGKRVLIVSKPHFYCVFELVKELEPWKSQILFRFTITAMDSGLLRYWEPKAPIFEERFACLKYSFQNGFKTSISIEPALDIPQVPVLVDCLIPYVSDKIWIGKMKGVKQRVKVETEEDEAAVLRIIINQTDDKIIQLYESLCGIKAVCFKDSIREVIENAIAWQKHNSAIVEQDDATQQPINTNAAIKKQRVKLFQVPQGLRVFIGIDPVIGYKVSATCINSSGVLVEHSMPLKAYLNSAWTLQYGRALTDKCADSGGYPESSIVSPANCFLFFADVDGDVHFLCNNEELKRYLDDNWRKLEERAKKLLCISKESEVSQSKL